MSQITLQSIISGITAFGVNHADINTSTFGDFSKVSADPNIIYPLFHFDLIDGKFTDKLITYNFNVVCCSTKELDESNLPTVYSLTADLLLQFQTYLIKSSQFRNQWRVELPTQFRTFPTKFIDGVAGHVMDISITVDNLKQLCDVNIEGGAV